ncbi:kinase-like domain-containing protein [Roridomyces roridus]|uniref:Kinase-like domain-containing protein n=1 Tax=Roridomyces roridus TaxID=1738132 RepID=A0AAD7CI83_9AGAR|nr:kinase-like domain-containing protein [Roridomyces roridus]
MIRRMADKLGQLGHSSLHRGDDDVDSLHSLASPTSSQSAVSSYHDHRGSISTQATSMSEWSTDKRGFSGLESDMEVVEEEMQLPALPQQHNRPRGVYRLSDFIIQRTLGTGSFGRVHLVRSKHNLRFYAIKVLNKERVVRLKQVEHTNNEQRMLELVHHNFIINLWGHFQDTANLYMVMDFVPGGELFTLLRRSNRFPDPVAKFYAAEVALALNHLHGLGVIYRDLKPENVLLNADGHIKVADFGFAKRCPHDDMDALGPSKVSFPVAAFSDHAKDLIMKLMEGDPSKRYGNMQHGAADVFAHAWFREVDWTRLEAREITAPYLPRIAGDGDASAFDKYPEDDVSATYGLVTLDETGHLFPDFEYTATPQ